MPPGVWPVEVAVMLGGHLGINTVFQTSFDISVHRLQDQLTSGSFRFQFALDKLFDMAF